MHVVNRVLLVLLALALIVLGVAVSVEAVRAALSQPGLLLDRAATAEVLASASWSDPAWIGVALAVAVVGLILLIAQLAPRAPSEYAVGKKGGRIRLAYTRPGLERLVAQVAGDHDQVAGVDRVRMGRRRAEVDVQGYAGSTPRTLDDEVRQVVAKRLDALELRHRPRVRAHATSGDGRTR